MIADLIKPAPVQPTSGLKLTLIHKSYNISGQNVIEERNHANRSAVQVNLDNESNALHVTLSQKVRTYVLYSTIGY